MQVKQESIFVFSCLAIHYAKIDHIIRHIGRYDPADQLIADFYHPLPEQPSI